VDQNFAGRPKMLVDPFLGGGSVPLSVLHEGMVERLILREIDEDVGAVWRAFSAIQVVGCVNAF